MRKSVLAYRIVVSLLCIAIVAVILVRFVFKKEKQPVSIDFPGQINLATLDGNTTTLAKLLETQSDLYLLVFKFNDCYSCILKGLNDMQSLKKDGRNCAAIVAHDYIGDIIDWSKIQDFSPFFVVKKSLFYDFIQTPHTPVIIRFINGKIKSIRFITP
jgi:hypothetical protein